MPAQEEHKEEQVKEEGKKEKNKSKEKDLFVWTAKARPFKRRDREFYVTVFAIAGVIGLILFFTEGLMPVILIISLIFLFYVLSTVEPESVEYKITDKGLKFAAAEYPWEIIVRFWFSRRYDSQLLVLEKTTFPTRMEMVVNGEDKEKIRQILKNHVNEEEAPPSSLDKAANWFSEKLPGNK